jgi:DNA helicase-2/ATP-dependent DNA helicase PcrA
MTIPSIELADIERLALIFPDLDFSDPERRAVLLTAGSADVQAAPGSGKTTLLAAKLLLLAQKWPHSNRGVCVLSHTNVARDEIAERLSQTAIGSRLLSYPHFVGTIHAFVNQFLALPLLRSDGHAIDAIDNDIFANRAFAALPFKYTLNSWIKNNPYQGPNAISTLRYEGPDLKLGWEDGNLPAAGTASHTQAKQLKDELAAKGIFRHEDMFAYAARLLKRVPGISKLISRRFPLVLIDEMQDTSWAQEELLNQIFDNTVVMQRYGDRNQRILSSSKDAGKLTFPRNECLHVTTTKRFTEHIASAVRAVQEHGEPIAASAGEGTQPPMLILYDADSAPKVIEHFGKLVLSALSDTVLQTGLVKAVCARKQGDANQPAGRHLGDYWPAYTISTTERKGEESIFRLLSDYPGMGVAALNLDQRVRDIKRAILLCLRAASCHAVKDVRDAAALMRHLESLGHDTTPIRTLCRRLTTGRGHTANTEAWAGTLDVLYDSLSSLFPPGFAREAFHALPVFDPPLTGELAEQSSNECVVTHDDRSVCIHIGTTASVKGETHAATLVLESYGGQSKKFDLQTALTNICDGTPINKKASELLRGQYRNLYVAMSRPRHLLCLAMNKERIRPDKIGALMEKGWRISEIVPAPVVWTRFCSSGGQLHQLVLTGFKG